MLQALVFREPLFAYMLMTLYRQTIKRQDRGSWQLYGEEETVRAEVALNFSFALLYSVC